jgi:hypothetical protein
MIGYLQIERPLLYYKLCLKNEIHSAKNYGQSLEKGSKGIYPAKNRKSKAAIFDAKQK